MITNKLKLLTISLFLNNVKSVHLQPAQNIAAYSNIDQAAHTNISRLEFAINQDRITMMEAILEEALREIVEVSRQHNNYTITFHNSFLNMDQTYRIIKNNEIIKIATETTPDTQTEILEPTSINYAVLALLYINSKNMRDLFIERANQNPNIPNEHVYLNSESKYLVIQDPNTYYIFPEDLRIAMENHANIGQILRTRHVVMQNEIISLCDTRQVNWDRIIAVTSLCSATVTGIALIVVTRGN